ncbi:hypothetical protein ACHAQA_001261 [Verticillium albo-atrum]
MNFFTFGDPNAQPPTPQQTPTSAVFPSPVFQTPKNRQDSFNDSAGWTPRFAEEYSVFNTTPGNLQGPFVDFPGSGLATYPASAFGHKRQLSAGGVAAEIATHVNHFSSNPNLPLPPVDPTRRLPSSPGLHKPQEYSEQQHHDNTPGPKASQQTRSTKKAKKKAGAEKEEGQTATPPPSTHKGGRKLTARLKTDDMQNDQGYGHPDFATGAPQHNMSFASTSDMFDYPMSAPAAPQASFWDPAADMAGMDLDFASFGAGVFGTPTSSHRQMGSFDATQMFLDNPPMLQNQQQQQARQEQDPRQPTRRERPLAPKQAIPRGGTLTSSASMPLNSYAGSLDDPFGIISPGGVGVDPGLLFSRPQSSGMDASFSVSQAESISHFSMADVAQTLSTAPMRQDLAQQVCRAPRRPTKKF